MKILTSKIVNGKKMFLIEDNDSQGRVFAQGGKPVKKENISYYNPYYVDVKGINSSDNVSTKSTPSKKITPQELKQIKESPTNVGNITLKEKQEKAQRLKEAEEAYQKRKSGAPVTPELLAQETQAIGDKISLQNIPKIGQYIPNILDVTGGIGSMASGLGAIPLNLNRGNYGQALLSVASPLAMGALAGVGSPTVGQFVNNVANPLSGTGDLINNLGNKYLPNAYKLNPFAFKPNPEMMYRGIGKEGMEDAIESGVFRAKQNVEPSMYNGFDMSKRFNGTYYTPKFETANQYGKGFIAEVPKDATSFRLRYKGKGNKTWSQIADENIPINKGRILEKDWLKRYKEVPKPQKTFKSEIDWAKWNKEIPDNPQLMKEYNTIEQTSKANGTWMKNPDGSTFQGTPEQFIQQNSENFKKAFPDGFENVFRGVNFHNNEFPEKAIFTGNQNLAKKYTNTVGKDNFLTSESHKLDAGIYNLAHKKSTNSIELNFNKDNWTNLPLKDKKTIINTKKKEFENYIKELKENIKENPSLSDVLNTHKLKNIKKYKEELKALKGLKENDPKIIEILQNRLGSKTSTDDLAGYAEQYNIDNIKLNNINDGGLGDVTIVNHKPGNYLKSLIGNNGMFDMTNPNIYKTIIGGVATGTLGKQAVEKQEFGGKIKVLDTKIENGKKYFLINK